MLLQVKLSFNNFGELLFLGLVDCLKFFEIAREFDNTRLQSLSKKMPGSSIV